MSRKLLTAEQLAKELKVGVETVTSWGRNGKIPRIRISHKIIRFDRDAVLSALSQTRAEDNDS
jgi:excisionase family DNA binding protein